MSLLYTVVFATRCRSNHHRLAVDALRHLRGPDAERWRDLLLTYNVEYLGGAKAPDEQFKDFKNHVLHVRDGDWGGAPDACHEWYRRTVRALADKDWALAAWSAGVMSHYYVDPIQPFHTGQTETENVIHRAVEWSFSKSYGTFQSIIENDIGGYPEIAVPEGDDWVREMVRQGARASNPHYETIIEHYNFKVGAKDPPAGLDQVLKDTIAHLVGHAVSGLARMLERAFEEAAVAPPEVTPDLQAFFLALETPIQMTLKLIDDVNARREVEAQYQEFQRTGKVKTTLGLDDKVVRALHAREVLNTPISSLDAQWPQEIGLKAGTGAAARVTVKPKPQPKSKAKYDIADLWRPAPKETQAQTPAPQPVSEVEAPKQDAKPATALDPNAPVVDAPAIGPKSAARLEAAGIKTVADLLAVSADEAVGKIGVRHISAQLIRDWQAQAALACAVPRLKSREAQALVACGVRDADALAKADARQLIDAITAWSKTGEAQRIWGEAPAPAEADVSSWIESSSAANKRAA